MTDHTNDDDVIDLTNVDRQIGLNTTLNIIARYTPERLENLTTRQILLKADAISYWLADGTLPGDIEGERENVEL